jgi:MFS transporter, OFA family, oxalate/formate antiporter
MKTKSLRWVYLAAGVVMMLFAGIIYAWSILKAPLAKDFGWNSATLGLNFTITMCFFCIGGILGGILTKRLAPRLTLLIGAVLVFVGFLISSNLTGNIAVLYLSYGVISGLGIGIAYNVVISSVTSWFPDKRGTASGALLMGFGASTLILGSISGNLLETIGWHKTYLALGISIFVILVIGSFFIKNAQAPAPTAAQKAPAAGNADEQEYTPAGMLRRASFWKFYILIILLSSIGTCVISFAKDISLKAGAAESLAILLVGVLSVFNGLGRIITGGLYDTIGRRKTMLIVNVVAIAAPILMLLSVLLSSVAFAVVGLIAVGLAYGSMPTISAAYTSGFYGKKNFPLNFSLANTTLIFASFSSTIGGALVTSSGSYTSIFLLLLAFAIVGLFINLSIKKA